MKNQNNIILDDELVSENTNNKKSFFNLFNIFNNKPISKSKFNIINKPNYSDQNYTEFMYKNLDNLIKNLNYKKVNFKGQTKEYIHATMDKFLKDELNQISSKVIKFLNSKKTYKYNFNFCGYGDIKIISDLEGNKNFIYELFLWDKVNYLSIKLNVNLIKYTKKENMSNKNMNENLVFEYYPIGIPSKEQLIPTAMDVIPTAREVLSTKSISCSLPSDIKYLYINSITIKNSDYIINYNNKNKNTLCSGYADGSNEFSLIRDDKNPYIEPAVIRNKWPHLMSMPKGFTSWPCTPVENDWNMYGIYNPPIHDTKYCPGKTVSAQYVPPQPDFNPTLATLPRNCGENYWLFDQTNASGAVSNSSSQPPP